MVVEKQELERRMQELEANEEDFEGGMMMRNDRSNQIDGNGNTRTVYDSQQNHQQEHRLRGSDGGAAERCYFLCA